MGISDSLNPSPVPSLNELTQDQDRIDCSTCGLNDSNEQEETH